MADMGFKAMGFDDFAKELEELGRIDELAPEILSAAAPVLEREMKAQVQKATDKGYSTGDLKKSIKANKPAKNKRGHYVSVTAKGKDRKGIRNNEKLAYLNYGTSKQQGTPVISNTIKNAEEKCCEAMQQKFDEVMTR